jgi:hypothetical protein
MTRASNFRSRHVIASGYTLMGIQTVAQADGAWWFGCYGKPAVLLRTDEKLQFTGKWEFNASVGIAPISGGRFLIAQNTAVKGKSNHAKVVIARVDEKAGPQSSTSRKLMKHILLTLLVRPHHRRTCGEHRHHGRRRPEQLRGAAHHA